MCSASFKHQLVIILKNVSDIHRSFSENFVFVIGDMISVADLQRFWVDIFDGMHSASFLVLLSFSTIQLCRVDMEG